MGTINVGAKIAGVDAPSKKALKIALADAPERVTFYTTATLFDGSRSFDGNSVPPEGLLVCYPNPYTARNGWAIVKVATSGKRAGQVVVS